MNTVPVWLQPRRREAPARRRSGVRGLGQATVQQFVAVSGSTVQAAAAPAGSTLTVLLDPSIVGDQVSYTGGVQGVNSNCIVTPTGFNGQPGNSCPNNQSSIELVLDGTQGTITIGLQVVGVQGNATIDPFVINLPGASSAPPYLVPPGGIKIANPPTPGPTQPPFGGSPVKAAPATSSSTGTVAAVAVGVVVVGGIAYWLYEKKTSGRSRR